MKQLSIDMLRDSIKNHSFIEYKFPDIDYTKTNEELENEITEYGSELKGSIIDVQTVNALLTVYNAMNEEHNKKKFERMLLNYSTFEKLISFCWSHVK